MKILAVRAFCITLLGLITALMMGGCATGEGRFKPPTVSLAELTREGNTDVRVRLRIRNVGERDMTARRVDFRLTDNGVNLLSAGKDIDFDIPSLGVETLSMTVANPESLLRLLDDLSAGDRPEIGYRLEGSVSIAPDGRKFEFSSRGQLTPTPGRPGSFR